MLLLVARRELLADLLNKIIFLISLVNWPVLEYLHVQKLLWAIDTD